MENKEDWEEINKWQNDKDKLEKEKYGLNFSDMKKPKKKDKNKFVLFLKTIWNTAKIVYILIALFAIFILILFMSTLFSDIKSQTNINIKETIESMYNIKIEVIDKQLEKKENGKYFLQVKDNKDIKFTAIKNYGNLKEDYSARSHKYYFERWNSEDKNDFTVKESIVKDLLDYETYIENFDDIEAATNKIINFANFCGNNFRPYWRVYLKVGDKIIYPYHSSDLTPEQAMINAKQDYERIKEKGN